MPTETPGSGRAHDHKKAGGATDQAQANKNTNTINKHIQDSLSQKVEELIEVF